MAQVDVLSVFVVGNVNAAGGVHVYLAAGGQHDVTGLGWYRSGARSRDRGDWFQLGSIPPIGIQGTIAVADSAVANPNQPNPSRQGGPGSISSTHRLCLTQWEVS